MSTNTVKYTQGEWYAVGPKTQEESGQTYFSIQTKEPEIREGTYVIPGFFYPHSVQTEDEMIANAKLIASSPTLLEALIEMVSEYEIFSDVPKNYKELEGYSGEENPRNIAIIKAKEAIAKATT